LVTVTTRRRFAALAARVGDEKAPATKAAGGGDHQQSGDRSVSPGGGERESKGKTHTQPYLHRGGMPAMAATTEQPSG
jgi:hypothetical protein